MSTLRDYDLVEWTPARERRFWGLLARLAASLPLAGELLAGYYCAIDRATPGHVRALLLGALGYFVLPFDAIPDVIIGFGFTDDASVLAAVIATVGRHIHPLHRSRAKAKLDELRG